MDTAQADIKRANRVAGETLEISSARRFDELPLIFAGVAILGGLVSFSGWILDVPVLADWDRDGIAIQPNPSVVLVLGGVGVLLYHYGFRTAVTVLGVIVALVGALTLSQHLFRVDWGIDAPLTFGRAWGDLGRTATGRMGPFASTCSTLLGIALILISLSPPGAENKWKGVRRGVPALCLGVIAISGFSIIAYLTGAKNFYAIPSLTAISFQAAILLHCLAHAVLFSVPDLNPAKLLLENSAAGRAARRLVPAVALLPPLIMVLRVRGEQVGFYDRDTGRAILIISLIIAMLAIQWRTLKVVGRYENEQRRAKDDLVAAHAGLEREVQQRTEQLRVANASLLAANEASIREREERIGLLRRVVNTQEAERRRIGRDLHDEMGQKLTGFRLALATMEPFVADRPDVAHGIANLRRLSSELDKDVSFLSWELRPDVLEHNGLAGSIRAFVEAWSKHHRCEAEFRAADFPETRFEPELEMNLYRIVQESLNNVAKHAGASSVSVILEHRGGEIRLIIEDDGRGFDADSLHVPDAPGGGLGLVGMRERAELIGGTLEIESAFGVGTTIYVRIPRKQSNHEAVSMKR